MIQLSINNYELRKLINNYMAQKLAKTTKKPAIKKVSKPKVKKSSPKPKLPEKLVKYLEQLGVKHQILEHRTVYTALDAAMTMRKKLGEIAKSLLVKADKDYYIVLLPADHNLDFKKLGTAIGKQNKKEIKVLKIPTEKVMQEVLKLKAGAMSAFGGFHNLPVVIEKNLAKVKSAVFSSGSYNHSIELAVKDFINAEKALLANFGVKKKIKVVKPVVKKPVKPAKKVVKKKK